VVGHLECHQVGLELGRSSGRGEVRLAGGPETYAGVIGSGGSCAQSRSAAARVRETIANCDR